MSHEDEFREIRLLDQVHHDAVLRELADIKYMIGQMAQKLDNHLEEDAKVHLVEEHRTTALEGLPPRMSRVEKFLLGFTGTAVTALLGALGWKAQGH